MGNGMPLLIPKWIIEKVKEVGTHITKEEYDILPPEKKANGTYFVDDWDTSMNVDQVLSTTSGNPIANAPVATAIAQLNNDLTTSSVQSLQLSNTRPKSDGISNDYFKIYKCGKVVTVFFDIALSSAGLKQVATLPEGYRPAEYITGCIPRFGNSSAMQYISFNSADGAINVYCDNIDSRLMFMYTFVTP